MRDACICYVRGMVNVILVKAPFGSGNEDADSVAQMIAKKIEYNSTVLKCPHGHRPEDFPVATIRVHSATKVGANVAHDNMCCEDYFQLLKAL